MGVDGTLYARREEAEQGVELGWDGSKKDMGQESDAEGGDGADRAG